MVDVVMNTVVLPISAFATGSLITFCIESVLAGPRSRAGQQLLQRGITSGLQVTLTSVGLISAISVFPRLALPVPGTLLTLGFLAPAVGLREDVFTIYGKLISTDFLSGRVPEKDELTD